MKHRGRIHFAMLLSSFEPYPLEYFTTGLHLQVEFGCHRCHERMEDTYHTVVARLRMMPRRQKKRKTRQGFTWQDGPAWLTNVVTQCRGVPNFEGGGFG